MDQGSAKKLKASSGNVSQRVEHNVDGLEDGTVGNDNGVDKENMQNGVKSNETSETAAKVNTSTKLNVNEIPLVNFTGYVEDASCENNPVCVVSAPSGLTSYVSTLDERQLKRERRKQANRESARKSRLRKQAEYEELVARWDALKAENEALQSELVQLNADSDKVRRENIALMEKIENSRVTQKGEMALSKAGADSTRTSNTEKLLDKSESLNRTPLTDHSLHENSNSETKLHQLLEPGSRTDTTVAAR